MAKTDPSAGETTGVERELEVRFALMGGRWFASCDRTWAAENTPEAALREMLRALNTHNEKWPLREAADQLGVVPPAHSDPRVEQIREKAKRFDRWPLACEDVDYLLSLLSCAPRPAGGWQPHPWMSIEEAIERLESHRESVLESATDGSVEWLLDQLPPDAPFRAKPFDQNSVFGSAADVVAFDVALAALRSAAPPSIGVPPPSPETN